MVHPSASIAQNHRPRLEVVEAIASRRDLTDLFRELARALRRVAAFDHLVLVLHDEDKGSNRIRLVETEAPIGIETDYDCAGIVGGPRGASHRLGMNRTTPQSRMKKLGIARDRS